MDFDRLYMDVLKIDSSIRYAAIQNHDGKKICGGFRDNITPILSDEELKMMHYYASQRWHSRKNIEHKLGTTKYAMAEIDRTINVSHVWSDEKCEKWDAKAQKFLSKGKGIPPGIAMKLNACGSDVGGNTVSKFFPPGLKKFS